MRLIFDHQELQDTARVLLALNQYLDGWSIDKVTDYMVTTAHREIAEHPSFISTLGFVLTSYPHRCAGALGVKASISTALVLPTLPRAAPETKA